MKTNNKHKAHAFWGAAFVLLIAMGCTQPTDGNTGGTVTPEAPFVEGGASLILSPDKLTIGVTAVTSDGSAVAVEGCTETELTSGTQTVLHAKGTRVILKGNIIKLYCYNNQLTALNVQGLTALQRLDCYNNQLTALNVQGCTALNTLWCYSNKLNADAFKKLFTDLPARQDSDDAKCYLYTEETGVTEGNHTDFTSPSEVQTAFENAKDVKHWKMYKRKMNGLGEEI